MSIYDGMYLTEMPEVVFFSTHGSPIIESASIWVGLGWVKKKISTHGSLGWGAKIQTHPLGNPLGFCHFFHIEFPTIC